MSERYTETAVHFDVEQLPRLLARSLAPGRLELADLDEHAYLAEIHRVLRPGGRAYVTTVFKKSWAWYFRKRDGESVLDTSHLREYTDLRAFRELVASSGLRIVALERRMLWFPLLDPLLFRFGSGLASKPRVLRALRIAKAPIPGCYGLELVVER